MNNSANNANVEVDSMIIWEAFIFIYLQAETPTENQTGVHFNYKIQSIKFYRNNKIFNKHKKYKQKQFKLKKNTVYKCAFEYSINFLLNVSKFTNKTSLSIRCLL